MVVLPRHQAKKPAMFFPAAMRLRATNRPAMNDAQQAEPQFVNFANHKFESSVTLVSGF
jgi:hypothetical protein